jgi:preprotein translocase subunit SecA
MLQFIDARWRDHLAEMDNLKDGIHLRWTVQADPLNAWQSEGFNMFGKLVEVIDNDYLLYIMHVETIDPTANEPNLERAVYVAADDPVTDTSALVGLMAAEMGAQVAPVEQALPPAPAANGSPNGAKALIKRPNAPDPEALVPIVKAQHEKVGRNDPCWCGSGKKFKFCHGAA